MVMVMYVGVLFVSQVAPFGDKTFLMYDLKRQYVDYYSYYRTLMSGDNNVFYSFSTTLGSGTLGFFAYYMMSPFLVILTLFERESIYLGIAVVIGLKLMLAAFIMDIELQEALGHIKKHSYFDVLSISVWTGALSWAFSGFLFAHSMNMMWMDVIILLPLHVHFLEKLINTGKRAPYILVLFAMLVLNYYITYQVILFTALWTLIRIFIHKKEKGMRIVLRVAISSFVSFMLSAVLMIPTFLELMNSPKDITELGLELKGANLSIIDFISKFPAFSYDYIEARFGYPQIFCGVVMVIFVMLFFLCNKVPVREKIGMAIFFAVMTLSMCLDILNLVWHAGMEPSGHPYRQAFIFVFGFILCACRAFSLIDKEISLPRVLSAILLMFILLIPIKRGMYDHFSDLTFYGNIVILAIYAIIFAVMFLAGKKSEKLFELVAMIIMLVNICDLSVNAAYTYHFQSMMCEGAGDYRTKVSNTQEAVNFIKGCDDSFYRMEDLNPRQQNDSLQYNYNGITHYSSAGMVYVRYFLQRLGFNDDTLYTHYGHDNTETADAILGVKYVMTDDQANAHNDYVPIFEGNKGVVQNPHALSVAIGTDGFDLTGISDEKNVPDNNLTHVPETDPFTLQENMLGRLSGEEINIFKDADVESSEIYVKDDKYCIDHVITAKLDGEMYMYLNGLLDVVESLSILVNDEFITTYGNASCTKILNLGYMKSGDSAKITVLAETENANFGRAIFVTEDIKALGKVCNKLQKNNCVLTKISSSHIRVTSGDHDGIFISIPFEEGWSIKVDGIRAEKIAVYDSLTYIPLDKDGGEHVIDMKFTPKGLYQGIGVSVLGLLALVYIIVSEKKRMPA